MHDEMCAQQAVSGDMDYNLAKYKRRKTVLRVLGMPPRSKGKQYPVSHHIIV